MRNTKLYLLTTSVLAMGVVACPPKPCSDVLITPNTTRPNGPQVRAGYLEWFEYFTTSDGAAALDPQLGVCPSGKVCTIAGKLREGIGDGCHGAGSEIGAVGTLEMVGDDPCAPGGAKVPLYQLTITITDADGTRVVNPCDDQPYEATSEEQAQCDGQALNSLKGKAIAVPGYWDEHAEIFLDKAIGEANPVFTLSCMTGAVAKCAHSGYVPWSSSNGESLAPYHRACVDAVRARFCGGSTTYFTCDGTTVDVFDRLGMQTMTTSNTKVESIWSANGLVCLTRENARWALCDGQISACETLPACPDTIDAPFWDAHPDALIAVAASEPRVPKCDETGGCCVSDPKHCPK